MTIRRGARWREEEQPEHSLETTLAFATPGAFRAARALIGLTQDEAAEYIGMSRRAIDTCEKGSNATLKSITTLRGFYRRAGLEFLGAIDLTTEKILGSGVCWTSRALFGRAARLPIPDDDANFSAARALLGLEERDVARETGLTQRQIGNLERGGPSTKKGYSRLRGFFEDREVEFLSSTAGGLEYPGAGVRVASRNVLLPPRLRAIQKGG